MMLECIEFREWYEPAGAIHFTLAEVHGWAKAGYELTIRF